MIISPEMAAVLALKVMQNNKLPKIVAENCSYHFLKAMRQRKTVRNNKIIFFPPDPACYLAYGGDFLF